MSGRHHQKKNDGKGRDSRDSHDTGATLNDPRVNKRRPGQPRVSSTNLGVTGRAPAQQARPNATIGSYSTFGSNVPNTNILSNASFTVLPTSASTGLGSTTDTDLYADLDDILGKVQYSPLNAQVPQQQQQQQYGVYDVNSIGRTLSSMSMATPAYAIQSNSAAGSTTSMQPQTNMYGAHGGGFPYGQSVNPVLGNVDATSVNDPNFSLLRGNDGLSLQMDNNAFTGATAPMGAGSFQQRRPSPPTPYMQNSGYQVPVQPSSTGYNAFAGSGGGLDASFMSQFDVGLGGPSRGASAQQLSDCMPANCQNTRSGSPFMPGYRAPGARYSPNASLRVSPAPAGTDIIPQLATGERQRSLPSSTPAAGKKDRVIVRYMRLSEDGRSRTFYDEHDRPIPQSVVEKLPFWPEDCKISPGYNPRDQDRSALLLTLLVFTRDSEDQQYDHASKEDYAEADRGLVRSRQSHKFGGPGRSRENKMTKKARSRPKSPASNLHIAGRATTSMGADGHLRQRSSTPSMQFMQGSELPMSELPSYMEPDAFDGSGTRQDVTPMRQYASGRDFSPSRGSSLQSVVPTSTGGKKDRVIVRYMKLSLDGHRTFFDENDEPIPQSVVNNLPFSPDGCKTYSGYDSRGQGMSVPLTKLLVFIRDAEDQPYVLASQEEKLEVDRGLARNRKKHKLGGPARQAAKHAETSRNNQSRRRPSVSPQRETDRSNVNSLAGTGISKPPAHSQRRGSVNQPLSSGPAARHSGTSPRRGVEGNSGQSYVSIRQNADLDAEPRAPRPVNSQERRPASSVQPNNTVQLATLQKRNPLIIRYKLMRDGKPFYFDHEKKEISQAVIKDLDNLPGGFGSAHFMFKGRTYHENPKCLPLKFDKIYCVNTSGNYRHASPEEYDNIQKNFPRVRQYE